jgi:hypothetical protein
VDTLPKLAPKEDAMRIQFHNLTRPKKAAKAVSEETGKPLAACQQSIAKACGYRDWYDLEGSLSPSFEEIDLAKSNLGRPIEQEVAVIASVAKSLEANAGDVQFALATSRLTGIHSVAPRVVVEIRRHLFELTDLPPSGRRERGAIGKLRSAGRSGEPVILRSYGRPTKGITHQSAETLLADFEYVSPKQALPLFVPMRLYVPYGVWTEKDGAKVLFSRDYKPLWRLRNGCAPDRINPWLRIEHHEETWFWSDANAPWFNKGTYEKEVTRLEAFGIRAMPVLVEALPLIVHRDDIRSFKDAVPVLEEMRGHKT